MTTPPLDPAFQDDADYARLRDVLHVSHFTRSGIPLALGLPTIESFRGLPRPTMAALTSAGRPLDHFVRLFMMHEPVNAQALAAAIAPMSLDSWVYAGILSIQGPLAFPAMGLALFEDLYLLHDTRMEIGPTYVMGVAGTSAALATQAIFAPGRLALDLGTGCGVLAFLASRRCTRVLATDKNPRAIAVAEFNARLNGITNVDFAVGDLYEPVKEYLHARTSPGFDFIYCNPPFVITPSPGYMYRDSGLVGDAIVEAVARGAGALLAEGGIAQFVCNWMHVGDQPWQKRLASWVEGSGCDTLVFQTKAVGPLDYASIWIEETEKSATPEQRWQMLNSWLSAYEKIGLRGVSFGMFTMRKAPQAQAQRGCWLAFDEVPDFLTSPTGPHIAAMLACRDYLAALDAGPDADAKLADAALWFSPHLRVQQVLRPDGHSPGSPWKHERDEIRLARGYPFAKSIDQRHVELIMAFDGSRTVRQVVEPLAVASKVPASALLPVVVRLCRQLLERAYVLPPGLSREAT